MCDTLLQSDDENFLYCRQEEVVLEEEGVARRELIMMINGIWLACEEGILERQS